MREYEGINEADKNGLKVINHVEDVIAPFGKVIRFEHTFHTLNQGLWQVFMGPSFVQKWQEPQMINTDSILMDFNMKQKSISPFDKKERMHARMIDFFVVNWQQLAAIFYTPGEWAQLKGNTPCFFEVDLGENIDGFNSGRIDFIGIGPDGRIFTLEFGSHSAKKYRQVSRHLKILREIIPSAMDIVPIIARYSSAHSIRTIQLRQLDQ